MTYKERVRRAIQHCSTDYVPASMDCVSVTWEKLMKKYGLSSVDEVQDYFMIDTKMIGVPYIGPKLKTRMHSNGNMEKEAPFGYWYQDVWNGVEYNSITTTHPLDNMSTIEEIKAYQWPNPDHFDYEVFKRQCDKYKDKAIVVGWPGAYQVITYFRDAEKFYMDMALEPEFTKEIIKHYMEFVLEYYERMFIAADGQIDILRTCDDYGTQCSMLFSIDMWREYFMENTKKLTDLAHKYGAYFMQHSCGAVRPIIPELIKCGVDILDPIQKVEGMEPKELKQEFGEKLTFHGGVDTQKLLPMGTSEEVYKESKELIHTFNQNGGYIFSSSQGLEGDIPIENIEAMYQARRDTMF